MASLGGEAGVVACGVRGQEALTQSGASANTSHGGVMIAGSILQRDAFGVVVDGEEAVPHSHEVINEMHFADIKLLGYFLANNRPRRAIGKLDRIIRNWACYSKTCSNRWFRDGSVNEKLFEGIVESWIIRIHVITLISDPLLATTMILAFDRTTISSYTRIFDEGGC